MDLPIPAEGCPSLNELVRAIAKLGGFIDRPKNDPGTQTLWIGLQGLAENEYGCKVGMLAVLHTFGQKMKLQMPQPELASAQQ